MKKILLPVVVGLSICTVANADEYVNGHTRANGTYVQGYMRSEPNSTKIDNYSSRGNINPYTGEAGDKSTLPSLDVDVNRRDDLGGYDK